MENQKGKHITHFDHVLLFDGVCNLCNRSVQFVLKRDRTKLLHFAHLQSEVGQDLIQNHSVNPHPDSVILIENGRIYDKSTAALRVCRHLKSPWRILYALIILPQGLRDRIYDWIARNRYKWFGKTNHCLAPHPKWEDRFL